MKIVEVKVRIRSIGQVVAEEKDEEWVPDIIDLVLKVIEERINIKWGRER